MPEPDLPRWRRIGVLVDRLDSLQFVDGKPGEAAVVREELRQELSGFDPGSPGVSAALEAVALLDDPGRDPDEAVGVLRAVLDQVEWASDDLDPRLR